MKRNFILSLVMIMITVMSAIPAFSAPSETAPTPGRNPELQRLIEAAQKEGVLNIYATAVSPQARTALQQSFKQKYGIDIEYTPLDAGSIVTKYTSEMAAGLYIPDIFHTGASQFVNQIKPMAVTIPMEPLLLLPEVRDPGKWYGGRLPFFDADKHGLMSGLLAGQYYLVNTDLVKRNEITSTTDILNPKFKGQIAMQNPTRAGAAESWVANILLHILGMEKGEKFLRDLARQEPIITTDARQLAEWVARGKYKAGIGISMAQGIYFMEQRAPVAFGEAYGNFKEPRTLTTGATLIYTFKNVPHPNARKLFINWFFSKEGSSIFAPLQGYPSTRTDVSTESFNPSVIPRPGDILAGEKWELKKSEFSKLSAEIFKDLLR